MRQIEPSVVEALPVRPPGAPTTCLPGLVEHDRLQYWAGPADDPGTLLEDFLAGHGLPVRDLSRPADHPSHSRAGTVCGAALFVSAAAGARMVAMPTGPASPAPDVPDLVAVVYRHGRPGEGTTMPRPGTDGWRLEPWQESWSPQQHAAAVELARQAIGRGDIYQVNVVGHGAARYTGNPLPGLARLARLPGARYGGVLTGAGWAIGCASPETLVEVAGGRVFTRPIKGTRPATGQGRRELLESAKERAEHVMIVDLERNDLARIARTGSVRVDELYAIRRWSDLWQAESTVSATLADGRGLADVLRAVCPGGSVTGAPKLAALTQIAALEPVGRGASMGGLGWIGPDRLDLGLTIRTAAVDAERVHVWAGGGITWGSDPTAEVAEAAAKAGPVRAALAGPAR
ncbi:chorismate-binding protein [Plantactinospora sp. S1510]|uniref:Chorismate-binding protein n=2 Tax=Plantactinospora alkalitolerans TaxID=2789879 RepID=A0ABS0H5P0_9ACTN|nr:chorismate-binding protein [Plantactinospora alkalitolerans]MBF9133649.1 chorismate-binding protein [Plantactinospora alkalitolerans]